MTENYLLGNQIRLSVAFKDTSKTLRDPTTVSLSIRRPDGVSEVIVPSKDRTGVYYYDYTPPMAGSYRYKYSGTGSLIAASDGCFIMVKDTCTAV